MVIHLKVPSAGKLHAICKGCSMRVYHFEVKLHLTNTLTKAAPVTVLLKGVTELYCTLIVE